MPSGEQTASHAVRHCIRTHCFDFLTMPSPAEHVVDIVARAHEMCSLQGADAPCVDNDEMIGDCEAMQQLFRTIGKVAATEAPVLVFGESGTGKELTAKSIHRRSMRAEGPFVAINCGAIPHHLLQSELFGYERGAFTGANGRKIGHVEAANGGTLFLDEIGDLPLESQANLLRFVQERTIQRLGGHDAISVDVRIISATHVDLEAAVSAGRFRADLYHRLCVLRLEEPPLRARGRDIEILAQRMFERYRGDSPRHIRGFSAAAINAMYRYGWPGNVRELINRVRRAIVMAESRAITPADLELEDCVEMQASTLAEARDHAERGAIEEALARHRFRLSAAAQELEVSRATLYRLMLAHGLRSRRDEAAPARNRQGEGHTARELGITAPMDDRADRAPPMRGRLPARYRHGEALDRPPAHGYRGSRLAPDERDGVTDTLAGDVAMVAREARPLTSPSRPPVTSTVASPVTSAIPSPYERRFGSPYSRR
jgi:DNA-binding NtrC family response regulator